MKKPLIILILFIFLMPMELFCGEETQDRQQARFEASEMCKGCHAEIYLQYLESEHSRSFTNPLFSAQYFKEVLPRAQKNPSFAAEARKCIFCHAPVVYMNMTGLVTSLEQTRGLETGVSCDFCHMVDGIAPNGDYTAVKSGKKQGPFKNESWHSEESVYITTSDFCAPCHNTDNRHGVEVKATVGEWRQSAYARSSTMCQDCHMNVDGFIKDGVTPKFQSGHAAYIKVGSDTTNRAPVREKIYTHRFPGAHSNVQIEGAMGLGIRFAGRGPRDGKATFVITVDNSRSGHKMPSGSSDLRLIWLNVSAFADNRRVKTQLLQLPKAGKDDFGIAGSSRIDQIILGKDIPAGSRVYRSIFTDEKGWPTLAFYDAKSILFDNRLNAGEIRKEKYAVQLPPDYRGKIRIEARLNYLGAPSSFTSKLGVKPFSPFTIVSAAKEFTISEAPPSPDEEL